MLFLQKLFKIPGPIELGRSKHDALPSREWTPDVEGYCWEDYDEEIKRLFPVKYFIANKVGDFIRYSIWLPITRPITDAIYWLKCYTLKSYRYHMLDLRQPCSKDDVANVDDCYR